MDSNKTIANGHKGSELPPTPGDAKMSVRHHKDSILYNLRHSKDHFNATVEHVSRMKDVAGDKAARAQAKKACAMLDEFHNSLAPYLSSSPSSQNTPRTPKA